MDLKQYKQLAEKRRAEEPVFDVTLPTGMVFKMRKPPVEQWMIAGIVPTGALSRLPTLQKAMQEAGENGAAPPEAMADGFSLIEFTRKLLFYACVSPRLSLDPQDDDEIHPTDIAPEDFTFMVEWCNASANGGEQVKSLSNFSKKRK